MTEYKDTLNLPTTAFPMKANLATREPNMLQHWEKNKLYEAIRAQQKGAKPFILHDGPPYANGHLHCGHALNKILKDIIIKSKTFSGFDAPYVPGWDCHGLPIELNVEKKIGKVGAKVDAHVFRQKCREYAASQIDIQRAEFKRLGVLGDWDHPYVTMDFHYEANVVRALSKIIANGHLHQGFKPVHWCIDCGSALAEAEVDYEDKISSSIYVAFSACDPQLFLDAMRLKVSVKPLIVPIWTTTPWTLPANEAVCLHQDIEYSLIDTQDNYMLVASDLVTAVMSKWGRTSYEDLGHYKGKLFERLLLNHPFDARQVPVILGDHVTIDSGTGCVHTAPAHGPDDYQVGQRYDLPLLNPVLANGCYSDEVPQLTGLSVLKANQPIIDLLRECGALLYEEQLSHSYPHCWRHKTPVIFRATPQWFVSMENNGLRDALLASIEAVDWIPDWGKARIQMMVKNRPDWCISRQRAWGTPMSLFVHKTTRALHPNTVELMEQVALRIEQSGIDAWFDLDIEEFLGDDAKDYEKINDTLDVWFDSGVTHYCVLKQNKGLAYPADLYLEGSDQHRGWFNSSLTTAVAIDGTPPYKTVLTHGYTVDAEGKKLSKSKGNYVDLDKLIGQYGADVLRLWVASGDYRNEVSISDEIFKRNSDAYRRIRNTARFLLANLFDFDPSVHLLPASDWVELDRWAVKRCQDLQKEILAAYEHYHFHVIYQKIHNFCAVDMGSFYLDVIKDRQYTTPVDSVARRSCQSAMYHMLHALVRWLAPILSFTAEEIWQFIPGYQNDSIFLKTWYQEWPAIKDIDMNVWQAIINIRDEVNKALETKRQEGAIGSGLAAEVVLYAQEDVYPLLTRLKDELRFILITSSAIVLPMSQCPADINPHSELGVAIEVTASKHEKCSRCWHRCDDVGSHQVHDGLCTRCVGNITGQDEVRCFA